MIRLLLLVIPLISVKISAQVWESFESPTPPTGWVASSSSEIQTTERRSLHGERSLEWSWTEGSAKLDYSGAIGHQNQGYRVFSFWVYLEQAMPDAQLRFDFTSNDQAVTGFDFNLNFTGWRTAFVPFNDMDGTASAAMNGLRIELSGNNIPETGTILLEQVVFSKTMDSRHQYEDLQVPFVRQGQTKTHWEPRVNEWGRDPLTHFSPSQIEIDGADSLTSSWHNFLTTPIAVNENAMQQIEDEINAFGLHMADDGIRGNHIFYAPYPGLAYPPDLRQQVDSTGKAHDLRRFGNLQLRIARSFHNTNNPDYREQLAEWFLWTSKHLLDQGWAAGSSQGTVHHLGYQTRETFDASFLMCDLLHEHDLLAETRSAIQWYLRAGQLLETEVEPNIDYYNTNARGQLLSLLMETDPELRAAWVMAFAENLSTTLATVTPSDGLGLKPDGTAFHHNGHYPAYSFSAFNTLGDIFKLLLDTPFQPTDEAHIAFRKGVLAQRIYSQTFDWPIAISGRHPFNFNFSSTQNAFAALIEYPHPESGLHPDPEAAAAYLRLWGNPGGELGSMISEAGIEAEQLDGMWSFPFANHAVVRRDNWMASMKGFSKYVWSSEIYSADNRYGRYQSNGPIEILYEGGRSASGFREAGWDWNRLPGATGVHLPFELLDSPRSGTLMRRSDETFAGSAVRDDKDGIFGVILHEDFFGDGLRARKSVTVIGDILIALGSGLESTDTDHHLETALFQNALTHPNQPHFANNTSNAITGMDIDDHVQIDNGYWLVDTLGTGYWLSPGSELRWHRKFQESRHNKTRAVTTGPFSTAWLDHGKAPDNASYHFIVSPGTTPQAMQELSTEMANPATAPYRILEQSRKLHAIQSNIDGALYISAFEPVEELDIPMIESINTPLLMVVETSNNRMHIAVTNPDLNPSPSGHPPAPVEFSVKGRWEPVEVSGILYWHDQGNTTLIVPTRMGMTYDLELRPTDAEQSLIDLPVNESIESPVLKQENPASLELSWSIQETSEESLGWIVERITPGSGGFQPIHIFDRSQTRWVDPEMSVGQLAAYRLRHWNSDGISVAGNVIPVYLDAGTQLSYDFRNLDSLDPLWDAGWDSFGINNYAEDLYLTSDGLRLVDNDPTLPAGITLDFQPGPVGSVSTVAGVTGLSNYLVNLSVSDAEGRLSEIQLTSRTQGFIESGDRIDFTDSSWDITAGPPRLLQIEWEPQNENELKLTTRYFGLTDDADQELTRIIPLNSAPESVTLQVGFGTAVGRNGIIRSLQIAVSNPSDTIPWHAFTTAEGTDWNLRSTSNDSLILEWASQVSPLDYGLELHAEKSTDLIEWSDVELLENSPIQLSLPSGSTQQYHRFRLVNNTDNQ